MASSTKPVAKAASNGASSGASTSDVLAALADESSQLFARRITRLEQVSILLRHLYKEHAQTLIAEKQQKANIYLSSEAKSHGEREGLASAQAINYSTEVLLLKGEITALEEERDFIKFCVEQDAGA